MSFEVKGLTDFQHDLLKVANKSLPKESKQIMRKVGSKARTHVARKARREVNKRNPIDGYHKKFKRGKVFKNKNGEIVVRVTNSSRHAHLIENGYIQTFRDGSNAGFKRGKHVLGDGVEEFDSSGQYESMLSEWIDGLLKDGKL